MTMAAGQAPRRVFLFLQGPASVLFMKIADGIEAAGGSAIRINLNTGDRIFWRRKAALNYRGRLADWQDYVGRCIETSGVTDIILTGEERPYHLLALAEARRRGIDVYVVEMGHLRPDWITLERDGLSSNSRFPTDPDYILRVANDLPEPDGARRFSQSFSAEASADLLYYLPTVFLWFLYPHYRRHGLFHPLAEYAGWLWRLPHVSRRRQAAERVIDTLSARQAHFFILPLQLQTDYQLRSHSPYRRQQDAIVDILRSFASHAPPASELVVKLHPLDNGLISWPRFIRRACLSLGLADRVHFIDGGDLARLVVASQGMVTVNSTAALAALQAGKPVKALGTTIYHIAGLTSEQPLDEFWQAPAAPQPALRDAFFRLLAATVQVRGNFNSRQGVEHAAGAIVERLMARTVNLPGAYIDPPPRRKPDKIDVADLS